MKRDELINVENLSISFKSGKKILQAIDGLSFKVYKGEILGVVGESGSGKSVSMTSLMGLLPNNAIVNSGTIMYNDMDLTKISENDMRNIRGNKISMIFQDPMTSLNPVFTVENQIVEAIMIHKNINKSEAKKYAIKLLDDVGIQNAETKIKLYPHEFSGGMRQRVMIAMAIACEPSLIIADEPTTALDVTVQAQILELLQELQKKNDTSIIFITHDLDVVFDIADRLIIMYAGEVVESGSVDEIFNNPLHPYTRMLIQSIPSSNKREKKLVAIEGSVPLLSNIDRTRCRFADRIPWISEDEHELNPQLREVSTDHFVRCTCYKNFYIQADRRGDTID